MSGSAEEPDRPANYAQLAGYLIRNAEARLSEKSLTALSAGDSATNDPRVARSRRAETGEHALYNRKTGESVPAHKDPQSQHDNAGDARRLLNQLEKVCSVFIKFGPFEVRPGLNQELPIGRAYQPVHEECVSRLQGFIGRDQYSLYIREVPNSEELGLRPSKNGIWVRQADQEFRRLEPGEAVRVYQDTDVRVGGDGKSGETGFQIEVC